MARVSFSAASLLAGTERELCANRRQAIPGHAGFRGRAKRSPPFASSALGGEHPLSTDFMKEAGATNTASVKRALTALCASDLIYRHDGEYKFVSPFFGAWVRRR